MSSPTKDTLQLRHQLGSIQNRFNDTEGELLNSKKQCLELAEDVNRLTREVPVRHDPPLPVKPPV